FQLWQRYPAGGPPMNEPDDPDRTGPYRPEAAEPASEQSAPHSRSAEADKVEQIVERFAGAWRAGQRPAIDDYLPEGERERRAVLVELVQVELELCLKAGEPARVEAYLERYPELAGNPEVVLDLLKAEYTQRRRNDPALRLDEYHHRFPQHTEH